MAFALNDSDIMLNQEYSHDPKFSDVKNILFESEIYMPTFVRRSSNRSSLVKLSSLVASPSSLTDTPNAGAFDEIEEIADLDDIDNNNDIQDHQQGPNKFDISLDIEENYIESNNEEEKTCEKQLEEPKRIKVFLRIRPTSDVCDNYQTVDNQTLWVENIRSLTSAGNIRKFSYHSRKPEYNYFKFDKIFQQDANQWPVFQSCALPLIQDFIIGENSLLFTYGITSSGKSYTMRGDGDHPGLIPNTFAVLFQALNDYIPNDRVPEFKPIEFGNCIRLTLEAQNQENIERLNIIKAESFENEVYFL